MDLLREMRQRRLFFDGGTGSLLQAQGLKAGELPEVWSITRPEVCVKLHRDYLEAGADIIKTNTFGANGLKFKGRENASGAQGPEAGLPAADRPADSYSVDEIVTAAMKNARRAVAEAGHGYIALDLGPTGKLLKPLGDLDFEAAVELYKEVVRIGRREGADLVLIETMSDSYELKAAVLAAKEAGEGLPVFATVVFDGKGKLLTGGNVESTVALLEGLRVDALGINCGLGPVQMKGIVEALLKVSSLPVIVNPNAGLPRSENGVTLYDIDGDRFAQVMEEIARMGACFLGGCCGTTPEHIQKTVGRCKDVPLVLPQARKRTVISSYSQAVCIEGKTVIIGERINPTGKSKFKQALRDHNLEYILKEGVTQQDNGAQVLDVNVGLPEIDEPSVMEEVVKELQAIIDLPLQIDTSNPRAMERALRVYNGKALINSVNGKAEVMDEIFPLVARYGGAVVALCLDESGIPETAEGRIQVAKKIIREAARYGIGTEDLIFDGLCMTVSSDSKGALTTLETLRRIRDELGCKSVLGVSNISFGLPQREIINASFFTMAMECGLSAAIVNPNSEAMMRAYYSFNALMDMDPQCGEYIRIYGGQAGSLGKTLPRNPGAGSAGVAGGGLESAAGQSAAAFEIASRLSAAIERGLREEAHRAVGELLETREPLDVINTEMIPALDRVGKGFEAGTIFLPQLLMSAEAAKAAFEVIKDRMASSGQVQEKKGTIILATVKGDIHDIGKNIVKVLLENYSYEVIDLGRDVPPKTIVQTAMERKVRLVGLSALMTTTVPSMEETIRLLREQLLGTLVMVGGAVLTPEYARTIGADAYCRDAMASVNYAEEVFAGT
ncbi:homocysteine S-methyltransferase family protein [Enterocloster asparagiformis]|uniref:homocysteine S-methyltransferase family protein n=1 Tax=Enterocloster asparagiformis TaxID=333367 RepID=UPI002A831EB9|nr:homocysteine S-methyltransferase family protein [Enterocloster asparagiformis]